MTVIAWDGKKLATDSRCTAESDIISDNVQKIFKLDKVKYLDDALLVVAFCGNLASWPKILDWMKSGQFPGNDIKFNAEGIIVGKKYIYRLEEEESWLIRYSKDTILTSGTGAPYASAALQLGHNIDDAVAVAIKCNAGCGGKIQIWEAGKCTTS